MSDNPGKGRIVYSILMSKQIPIYKQCPFLIHEKTLSVQR